MLGVPCPYGDASCPCQDGDACHYEAVPGLRGPGAKPWPAPPVAIRVNRRGCKGKLSAKTARALAEMLRLAHEQVSK